MQNTAAVAAKVPNIGDTATVVDARDGTSYRVGRLADGNIWMLDNLALDLTALTQEQIYGTGDNAGKMTNASNTTLGCLKGVTVRNLSTDSAGSYCYETSDTAQGTSFGNATEDICPAGWHMPSGDTANGSYYYLYNTGYSANYNNFVDALSTPLSGRFYAGKASNQGYHGLFWSSTRYNNNIMHYLGVNSSNVYLQNGETRYRGLAVRCIVGS